MDPSGTGTDRGAGRPDQDEELELRAAEFLGQRGDPPCMWARSREDGRLLWYTAGFEQLLGSRAGELLSSLDRFREVVHPTAYPRFDQGPSAYLGGSSIGRLLGEGGEPLWVRIQVGEADTVDGSAWVGCMEDVTAQVEGVAHAEWMTRSFGEIARELDAAVDADVDVRVRRSLELLAGPLDAPFVTVFRQGRGSLGWGVFEWCAPGVPSQVLARAAPSEGIARWMADVVATGSQVLDVSQLPGDAHGAVELAREVGFSSVALVSSQLRGGAAGFVAIGSRRPAAAWTALDLDVVERVAHVVHSTVLRTDAERESRESFAAMVAAREEAERANAAKSEFLSRVSHELRSPISAVVAAAELMQLEGEGGDPGYLERIISSARAQLRVVDDLLEVARTDQLAPREPAEVELHALARSVLDEADPPARRAEVRLVLADTGPARLFTDAVLVHQVLANLVSNAVKYNQRGGQVTVEATTWDHRARLVVSDTGPGFDEGAADRLWAPFDRLGAEHGPVPGSGLGLSIVRHAVEQLGGEITFDTSPAGTSFTVTLQPLPAGGDAVAGSVLVVDDNETWRSMLESALRRWVGVQDVRTAADGAAALAEVSRAVPDLVLLDRHLSDADGEKLLARLRDVPGAGRLPVVVVTADVTGESRRRCMEAGADGYMVKPPSVAELRETVTRVLAQTRGGSTG